VRHFTIMVDDEIFTIKQAVLDAALKQGIDAPLFVPR
jgi:hypothetical protein